MKLSFHISIYICCLLAWCLPSLSFAQSSISDSLSVGNGLRAHFVKYNKEHDPGSGLFFNSLKIENISDQPITFVPKIELPENWVMPKFIFLPKSVTLPPKGIKYIPFKANVPSATVGDRKYTLKANLKDAEGKILLEPTAKVYIPVKREWKMKVLDDKLILLRPDSSRIKFKTKLQNLGNTNEIIMLQMKIEDTKINQSVVIPPGRDTILTFEADYKERTRQEGANKEYVEVYAETDESFDIGEVPFVKFKNQYDGKNARIRPNSMSIGFDNLTSFRFNRITFNTGGIAEFGKNNRLIYGIDNTDLLNFKQFFLVSNVFMQYLSHKFEFGLGNITTLGENIHNVNLMSGRFPTRNGFNNISGKYKHHFNPNHTTNAFVSYNIRNPITTVAASHKARFHTTLLEAGGSYTLDFFGKKSTKIAFLESMIPVRPNHFFGFSMNYARETHHVESFGPLDLSHLGTRTFGESSYSFSTLYQANVNNLAFIFHQSYGSPRYPGFQKGALNISNEIIYTFPSSLHSFKFNYRLFKKPRLTYNNAVAIEGFDSKVQEGRVEYEMPINRYVRMTGGLQAQDFEAGKVSMLTNEILPYNSRYFGSFITSDFYFNDHNIELLGYYGISTVRDFISPETGTTFENISPTSNIFLALNYYVPGITFGTRYLKGSNAIIQDYETGFDETLTESFIAYLTLRQHFFKQTIQLRSNFSFRHEMFKNRTSLVTSPTIEIFLKYGWSIWGGGTYSQLLQASNGRTGLSYLARTRAGIRKNFDMDVVLPHHNFEVVAFEDINGNGKKDKDEKGVADVQVAVKPVALGKTREVEFDRNKYKKVTLFTNKEGRTLFKKLPEGQHNIHILQIMSSTTQFVNTIGNYHTFELEQNQVLYLPFKKANKIKGKISISQDKFAKQKLSPANIRVTATDKDGNKYDVLTRADGTYEIPLPSSEYYILKINNPFGKDTKLLRNNIKVTFEGAENKEINFNFKQRQRKINFN